MLTVNNGLVVKDEVYLKIFYLILSIVSPALALPILMINPASELFYQNITRVKTYSSILRNVKLIEKIYISINVKALNRLTINY